MNIFSDEVRRNPYPIYDQMRAACPALYVPARTCTRSPGATRLAAVPRLHSGVVLVTALAARALLQAPPSDCVSTQRSTAEQFSEKATRHPKLHHSLK